MAFTSYDNKLRRELNRREAAMLKMKMGGDQVASAVQDNVARTRERLADEIESARSLITEKITEARTTVSEKISEARISVGDKITEARDKFTQTVGDVRQSLTPTVHIRQHPWAWLAGSVALGIVSAPALRSMFRGDGARQAAVESAPTTAAAASPRQNLYWMPLMDAFLPVVVDFVRQRLHLAGRLSDTEDVESYGPMYGPGAKDVPPSISRRMAQPPKGT